MVATDDAGAGKLVGKTVIISDRTPSFPEDSCKLKEPATARKMSAAEVDSYLRDNLAGRDDIELKDDSLAASPVFISDGCIEGFVTKKGNLLLIAWTNVFYQVERVKAHHVASGLDRTQLRR
ncbi:hypothetical protein LOC54_10725 [Acetobacter sp. AN02]|uniref:hypothetical protein n=1 Tax=Acetobacter sp. AN02 TaxID=2894186 RepID=UPI0024340EFE|nr:hypothetical protein [Acetobacter sp. AN02]MDG6095563.1 hypothetical protein [Acetobacter sp. AN02]